MSDIILELREPTMCYDKVGKCYTQSTMEEAADYIEKLEAKLAAAEADAERYRWLRDNGNIKWSLDFDDMVISFEADPRITEAGAAGLDAAVDAARGAK